MKIQTLIALSLSGALLYAAVPPPMQYNFGTTNSNPGLTNAVRDVASTLRRDMNAAGYNITNVGTVEASVVDADTSRADALQVNGLSILKTVTVDSTLSGATIVATNFVGNGGGLTNVNSSNVIAATNTLAGVTMPVLNVKTFGAAGNGVTDDTLAIRSAVAAAKTNTHRLYFPSGTYRIGTTLDCGGQGLEIFGDGRTNSIILGTNGSVGIMNITPQAGGLEYVIVRDLCLKGVTNNPYGIFCGGTAMAHSGGEQFTFLRLNIHNCNFGMVCSNVNPVVVEQCRISANEEAAIVGAPTGNMHVRNCELGYTMGDDEYGWASAQAVTNCWCGKFYNTIGNGTVTIENGEYNAGGGAFYFDALNVVTIKGGNIEGVNATNAIIVNNMSSFRCDGLRLYTTPATVIPFKFVSCRNNNVSVENLSIGGTTNYLAEVIGGVGNGWYPNVTVGGSVNLMQHRATEAGGILELPALHQSL